MNVSLGKPKDVVIPDVPTVSIKHVDHPGHTCCKHVHGSTERCKNEFGRMVVPSNGQERWIKLPRGLVCKAMVRQHPGASVDVTYICINNHDQIIAIRGSTGEEVKVDVNPKPVDLNQSEQETTELVTPGVYTVVHRTMASKRMHFSGRVGTSKALFVFFGEIGPICRFAHTPWIQRLDF